MYQFWKYFSTNKTITLFASYPSAETKLRVFLLSPHILPSLHSVLRFSIFYSVLSSSLHLPRCHFTYIIIHATATRLLQYFNTVSEHVVSPLVNIQIPLLFSGILVLWRTLTSSAESRRMSQETLHWLYGRICIQSNVCAAKLTKNKWCYY